jgi:hypothetical protein
MSATKEQLEITGKCHKPEAQAVLDIYSDAD